MFSSFVIECFVAPMLTHALLLKRIAAGEYFDYLFFWGIPFPKMERSAVRASANGTRRPLRSTAMFIPRRTLDDGWQSPFV